VEHNTCCMAIEWQLLLETEEELPLGAQPNVNQPLIPKLQRDAQRKSYT
jgi:hypothetical protein